MDCKHITILGGGISGLSAAYFLDKYLPNSRITLVEKTGQLGGLISPPLQSPFFETGPKTLAIARNKALLELIHDLKLSSEVIEGNLAERWIWNGKRLQMLSKKHLLRPQMVLAMLSDLCRKKSSPADTSVQQFIEKRFSRHVASTVFDPIGLGIYATSAKELSLSMSFPLLKKWEQKYGSVIRGFRKEGALLNRGVFTLQSGLYALINALYRSIHMEVLFEESVLSLEKQPRGMIVHTSSRKIFSDYVISALPLEEIARLMPFKSAFKMRWVQSVYLSYDQLPLQAGFGYLVPSHLQEEILGAVFDSHLFPKQERRKGARITVMMKAGSTRKETAIAALSRHLAITKKPDFAQVHRSQALPWFHVGFREDLAVFINRAKVCSPRLYFTGNYIDGVSVNACIKRSLSVAEQIVSSD